MCQFFKKRGYPYSAVITGKHRAQEIDRETALQTSQNEETDRIPFNLTYDPQNLAIKDGAEINCRIAHILGILLMNSCNTVTYII